MLAGTFFFQIENSSAQYISLQGVNTTKVLSDYTTLDFDISSAFGGEVNYSNSFFFGLYYNIGTEYLIMENANLYLLKTGISKVYLAPSSFNRAKNKESVSYITNNWLSSIDLNFYNGALQNDSSFVYAFAAEPCWNVFYALGNKKTFFIGGEIGLRYTLFSSELNASEIGIPFQIGIKYEL